MAAPEKIGIEFRINAALPPQSLDPAIAALWGPQNDPEIAVLSDGRVAVAFRDYNGLGAFFLPAAGVTAQVMNADGSAAGAQILVATPNSPLRAGEDGVRVSSFSGGGFVVSSELYLEGAADPYGPTFKGAFYSSSSAKVGAFSFASPQFYLQHGGLVTAAYGADKVAVAYYWADAQYSSPTGIYLRTYSSAGAALSGPTPVSAGSSQLSGTETASLSSGGFVVAWDDFTGGGATHAIRYQLFDASGVAIGGNLTASTVTHGATPDRIALSGLANGGVLIAHADSSMTYGDNSGSGVVVEIMNAAGVVTNTLLANTTVAGAQNRPDVVGLTDGRFFVVWVDGSGTEGAGSSGTAIRGQMFLANGAKDGAEILINTFTFGDQLNPSVTQMPDGRLLVAWDTASGVLDNQGTGISGQFLETRTAPIYQTGIDKQWFGTPFGDVMTGTDAQNALFGGGGNDFIWGFGGADSLQGNAGIDYLDGGDGNDSIFGGDDGDNLQGGAGADYLLGGAGHDFVFGLDGDDVLYGDATVDEAGIDTMLGGAGADWLFGMSGSDVLYGDDGADILLGGAGVDWLFGGAGDDVLYGEGEQDFIYGAAGTDYIYTGAGNDYVYFETGAGTDVLVDWTNGQDVLVFQGIAGVTSMANLTISDGGGYVAISYAGNLLYVQGATVAQFDPSDFIFL